MTSVTIEAAKMCKVAKCRHPESHNTQSHVCGKCNKRGHGQIECTRGKSMNCWILSQPVKFFSDEEKCRVQGCKMKPTHTTQGHVSCVTDNPNTVYIKCPTCRNFTSATLNNTVITGEPCIICYNNRQVVVFEHCRHCNVCSDCIHEIHETEERRLRR